MVAKMSIKGDKELIAKLSMLRGSGQRRAVNSATRASLLPLKRDSKAAAPQETKQLKKSLASKVVNYPAKGVVFGIVGVAKNSKNSQTGRNPSKYLHLVTGGTRAHVVGAKNKRVLHFQDKFTRKAHHPGAKPNDFLLRAFNSGKGQATSRFSQRLAERITAEAMKGK